VRLEDFQAAEGWTDDRIAREVRRYLPRGTKTGPSTISRLKRRSARKQVRHASVTLALAIEQATNGKVRAEDLPLTAESKRLLRTLRQSGRQPCDDEGAAA
jgi:hypothetical protein